MNNKMKSKTSNKSLRGCKIERIRAMFAYFGIDTDEQTRKRHGQTTKKDIRAAGPDQQKVGIHWQAARRVRRQDENGSSSNPEE